MHRYTIYCFAATLLSMATVGKAAETKDGYEQGDNNYAPAGNDYASAGNDYDYAPAGNDYASVDNDHGYAPAANDYASAEDDYNQDNNDYASVGNDYDQNNNDYNHGNDYGKGNDYVTAAPYQEDTTTVVVEGSSPCDDVVTPQFETVVQDVVNTVMQYSTVLLEETQTQSVTAQITSIQMESVAAQEEAVYQVTQTYVCPPPPTVSVNNVNTVWVTETATPTVQVVQTRVQPQVVVQPVTVTHQVQQMAVETQVIQEQATAVYTTNMHNMVQVIQENVGQDQLTTVVIVPDAGAADHNQDYGVHAAPAYHSKGSYGGNNGGYATSAYHSKADYASAGYENNNSGYSNNY
ncbi:hypothetical protein COEREDRAFT_84208 [Coemansia reversa NRRL 1564]|uniref:Uncharacterized protein n=1 Tax=Coemansia reversa (strain ATCC 12441 / NRRL 1564) TaxID=763665 RepID=A0A2G5BKP1_COERN|nr:hypothetical protein COEREDRAFT_84208 [Coemansia reversa NRRL 1564]|eukprot:PIA19570.1 hypothetical protein COEREDRAFT_84208 [Coemansia reversa NRRL 1564]